MRTGPFSAAVACLLMLATWASAAPLPWKVGMARIRITPRSSLWLAGFAKRSRPSEGVAQHLFARALALEDQEGRRAVLVTTDMLGFPTALSKAVATRVERQYRLSRDRLVLTSSHTHSGPVVDKLLAVAYDMSEEQRLAVEAYTRELEDKIVAVIGGALRDLAPAGLSLGRTEARFAANRRARRDTAAGPAWPAPVDHDVPFLRVEGRRGRLRGVVFGYACHNTTIVADSYQFHGDYAGCAEEWLERRYPGAVAFFVAGCGADANPSPRGSVGLAQRHGEELATAVDRALRGVLRPVRGPLKSAFEEVPLAFAAPPTPEELSAQLSDENVYRRRYAAEMLKILERGGRLPTAYPYPLQVWQFGRDLTFVVMAGEVVVDYSLRLKKELGAEKLWVAAYSNDVFAYIPSRRVLEEGGYEAAEAMIYYLQPGPFAPSVEETLISKVHELVGRLRPSMPPAAGPR